MELPESITAIDVMSGALVRHSSAFMFETCTCHYYACSRFPFTAYLLSYKPEDETGSLSRLLTCPMTIVDDWH
jgi:hypothetical protein